MSIEDELTNTQRQVTEIVGLIELAEIYISASYAALLTSVDLIKNSIKASESYRDSLTPSPEDEEEISWINEQTNKMTQLLESLGVLVYEMENINEGLMCGDPDCAECKIVRERLARDN